MDFTIKLLCLCAFLYRSFAALPENYELLSGREKQAIQWENILNSHHNDSSNLPTIFPRPGSNVTHLHIPRHHVASFLHYGDEYPEQRHRIIIGPYGVVAKINFRAFQNSTTPYTGVFRSGGSGLIRLALNGVQGHTRRFVTLLAAKIYVDGDHSRNFLQASTLLGQAPNRNFFQNNMSNIIDTTFFPKGEPVSTAFMNAISLLPGDALARPLNNGNLGQYDAAMVYANGTNASVVVAPWETLFVPNGKLGINEKSTRDFRLDIIEAVKVGDVIYTVYARRTPDTQDVELIGEVACESRFVASTYGDDVLFFRHPRPQWRPFPGNRN